ncbi:MAG TPA: phosphatidylglycerophosphatase A [Terriglobales bacterium]|nr:phosphatidylglycerophosphatase A [Terriglobales bacterium]
MKKADDNAAVEIPQPVQDIDASRLDRGATLKAGTWAWLLATFFWAGRLPAAPGTWGSAATILLWWGITRWLPTAWQPETAVGLAALAVALGIPAATRVARELGRKDPGCVVIDEVAGQLITLIAVPVSWKTLLAGFILFRAFDTTKPPPVRQLERLPEGTGIVVDDVGAGIYALIVMQVLLHYRVLGT